MFLCFRKIPLVLFLVHLHSCLKSFLRGGGYVPPIWRTAFVRPVFKGGDSTLLNNYRPISLTCTCCKIMEGIISDKLLDYLFVNNSISKHQHGFIRRRSTCTQLLESFQDWTLALRDKNCVDTLYLDFSRAFDSLVHSKLMLSAYGIQYELFEWICSFINSRSQQVLIEGHLSSSAAVKSGSGQGSILGPLFFVLFINDISDCIDSSTTCKRYADDVKLYTSFDHCSDPISLHTSLYGIQQRSIDWLLTLNPSKCTVLHLGSNNPDCAYLINNVLLDSPNLVRDLGVTYNIIKKTGLFIMSCNGRTSQIKNSKN